LIAFHVFLATFGDFAAADSEGLMKLAVDEVEVETPVLVDS
jgi:hypothetical protein